MNNRRITTLLLAGMSLVTLVLVGGAITLFLSGDNSPLVKEKQALRVYVQAPPEAVVGEETKLVVTVQNVSSDYLSIDEIRLPEILLESAEVASIVPGTLTYYDYEGERGYQVGFLMAPEDQRQFEITLLPRQTDDFVGDVRVMAGDQVSTSGFRLVFEMPVALAATQPPAATSTPLPLATPTQLAPTPTIQAVPYASVVRITAQNRYSSYLKSEWGGSGSIVSKDGLILTNAHLIEMPMNIRADFYLVSLTENPATPPVDMYFAEPLIVDEDLDLAVLRIVTDLKYNPVDPDELNLTPVQLGDSDTLELGAPLIILGYPGIGGDTVTLTRGDVGGFTLSRKLTEPAFIKTSATISGGTSGGMALDEFGRLVAVPTQLGYGQSEGNFVDCRVAADTNGDGKINEKDACIPVGGFINALRPINLAKPLIERAQGITTSSGSEAYPSPVP